MNGNDFFTPWEGPPVTSWSEAQVSIQAIIAKVGSRTMAWRGHVDAAWGLHSSLYRKLRTDLYNSRAPEEVDLLARERAVINYVRARWRFDHMPCLQLLAQLQHFRAPTRMLDVSLSPLVGLWFAVEEQFNEYDSTDGRLFSFDVSNRHVTLTPKWIDYELPWKDDATDDKWCYELPMFWRPPAYNERIPAQQSGFLLAGVPKMKGGGNAQYRRAPGGPGPAWRVNEVRQATSVPTRMIVRERSVQGKSEPTLTLRIKASAKPEIRHQLERFYGMNSATLYPDAFGMAEEVQKAITQDVL